MVGEDGNDLMEDSEHGLWDDLKYQWGCVGRRRGKVGGRDGEQEGGMDRRDGGRGRDGRERLGYGFKNNTMVMCLAHTIF